jgi:hypothetical protein
MGGNAVCFSLDQAGERDQLTVVNIMTTPTISISISM